MSIGEDTIVVLDNGGEYSEHEYRIVNIGDNSPQHIVESLGGSWSLVVMFYSGDAEWGDQWEPEDLGAFVADRIMTGVGCFVGCVEAKDAARIGRWAWAKSELREHVNTLKDASLKETWCKLLAFYDFYQASPGSGVTEWAWFLLRMGDAERAEMKQLRTAISNPNEARRCPGDLRAHGAARLWAVHAAAGQGLDDAMQCINPPEDSPRYALEMARARSLERKTNHHMTQAWWHYFKEEVWQCEQN